MDTVQRLDWSNILAGLSDFATCESAKRLLRALPTLADSERAAESFEFIEEIKVIVKTGIRPHAESLDLAGSWLQRILRKGTLKPLELKDVRHFCVELIALEETLKPYPTPHISRLKSGILPAEEPLSAIDQILTPQGDIRSDASERLYRLNEEKTRLARQVQVSLNRIVKDYQIEHLLQDRFVTTREGRWVIPIKSGMQHSFQGIIHDSSQSKQTVFMEPQEIVPTNNRLREIEIEIEDEIERLLTDLSKYLHTIYSGLEQSKDTLLLTDQMFAKAQLAVQLDAHPCEFTSDSIELKELRHPILIMGAKNVIPNDLELHSNDRILLLSGPNAGGKTVLLKAVGLAAQMARCGLPICADPSSKIPFFKKIVVSIGDSQSVDADLSTFAAHLKTLEQALVCESSTNLILIDEICGSTDPEEGAALARSFINAYSRNKVFGVITSHLGALKLGWPETSGVINGSLEFDSHKGPSYKFIKGVPGQSLAIRTAKRVGVRQSIIDEALENLSPEVRRYQDSLNSLENTKKELLRLQEQLAKELKQSREEKLNYQEMVDKFNKEKSKKIEDTVRKAQSTIDDLINEANVKEVFQRHEALTKIKYDLPAVIKSSQGPQQIKGQSIESLSDEDEFASQFPPGSTVYIPTLGRDGIIQGLPNAKGEVPVLTNSMRMLMHWRTLKPALQQKNPTQALLRKKGYAQYSGLDIDRVVDVRGLSADEATSQLEIQLDTASLAGESRVKVIHGHGTDTLKKSVRSYLSRSVYVKSWQAGRPDSGGDGITWVEIK